MREIGIMLAWTLWISLGTGYLELTIFWSKCHFLDSRNMNISRHYVWMFPVSGLFSVGVVGGSMSSLIFFLKRNSKRNYFLISMFSFAYVSLLFRAPIYTSVCGFLAPVFAWKTTQFLQDRRVFDKRGVLNFVWVPLLILFMTITLSFGRELWRTRPEFFPGQQNSLNRRSKNVILIVMDTVRADHLELYGYSRRNSPRLLELANRGVRFNQALSTAPWTAPSHASMFTGFMPHELTIGWKQPLDKSRTTLADFLGSRGFTTAGFVGNTTYCSEETGLARGFEYFEDYDVTLRGIILCSSLFERSINFIHNHPQVFSFFGDDAKSTGDRKTASRINRDFLKWIDSRKKDRPFFAFLNYYDAHHPYLSPEFNSDQDWGRRPTSSRDFRLLKSWWERDKLGIKEEDLALAVDSYDRCIGYLDSQLGRLFDDLARRGLLENSIVIVTSDHGEHLGEHDLFGHGCSLYNPELHVPLLIFAPGLLPEGKVVRSPASLRDIPATVVDLLGFSEGSPFPGNSLVKLIANESESAIDRDFVRSEVDSPPEDDPNRGRSPAAKGPMVSLVNREYHYIRQGDGHEQLFDRKRDSQETHNLATLPEMTSTLERFRAELKK